MKDWVLPGFSFNKPRLSQGSDDGRLSQQGKPSKSLSGEVAVNGDDELRPSQKEKTRQNLSASTFFKPSKTLLDKAVSLDTLAVNRNKVDEVRKWLKNCRFNVSTDMIPSLDS